MWFLFVKTNVIKQTPSTVFVGVDSGLNHLIRPMFYDSYHHIINISNPTGKPRVYNVVGYICETDTFASNRVVSEIHPMISFAFKMQELIALLWHQTTTPDFDLQKY